MYDFILTRIIEPQNLKMSIIEPRYHNIPCSTSPCAIVACPKFNCLYVSDQTRIYRYDLKSNSVKNNWSVGDVDITCQGISLSLTGTDTVIATLYNGNRIREYTPDGAVIHDISLSSVNLRGLQHCIKLSSDQFVVSNSVRDPKRQVCIVDKNGIIIHSYVGPPYFDNPCHLAVDKYGHVMVADYKRGRVELLSPTLTHLGSVKIPKYDLNGPWNLHLDELNCRLCICEWGSLLKDGRLFVLEHFDVTHNKDVATDTRILEWQNY